MQETDLKQAIALQKELSEKIILHDAFHAPLRFIGGMDVSHNLYDPSQMIHASVVLLEHPSLKVIETVGFSEKQSFPYKPGLLGFREAPALLQAYEKLNAAKPDLIFVDGHGIAHPRRLGIASHVGVLLDIPTIGVAKSILVGEPEGELGSAAGAQVPLVWKGRQIGIVFRSKKGCNPLIISPGHRVSFESALAIVQACLTKYRLPEPTRQAHLQANAVRIKFS